MKKIAIIGTALILIGCMNIHAMLNKKDTQEIINIITKLTNSLNELLIPPKEGAAIAIKNRSDFENKQVKEFGLGPATCYMVEHIIPSKEEPSKIIKQNIKNDPNLSLKKWNELNGSCIFKQITVITNSDLERIINIDNRNLPRNTQMNFYDHLNKLKEHLKKTNESFPYSQETQKTNDQIKIHNELVKKILNLKQQFFLPHKPQKKA